MIIYVLDLLSFILFGFCGYHQYLIIEDIFVKYGLQLIDIFVVIIFLFYFSYQI